MKRIVKSVIFVLILVLMIVYVGYKFSLYPTEVIKDSKDDLQDKITEVVGEGDNEKNWLRKIFDGLDAGVQSNESKKEVFDVSEFEASLKCFLVTDVVDGDTIWVTNDEYPGGVKVRYIGIDAPESVHEDESKNSPAGKLVAKFNSQILKKYDYEIYLEFDEEKYDEYERLLAYAYVYDYENDKYISIQDMLLSEGYCKTLEIEPNTKYAKHFAELEAKAKEENKGFWQNGTFNER